MFCLDRHRDSPSFRLPTHRPHTICLSLPGSTLAPVVKFKRPTSAPQEPLVSDSTPRPYSATTRQVQSPTSHETLTYYAFPDIHRQKIRTNNPLERIMREIRRRIRVVGPFQTVHTDASPTTSQRVVGRYRFDGG